MENMSREEFWSSVTHGIGFIESDRTVFPREGIDRTNPKHIIGGLVFGLSLVFVILVQRYTIGLSLKKLRRLYAVLIMLPYIS